LLALFPPQAVIMLINKISTIPKAANLMFFIDGFSLQTLSMTDPFAPYCPAVK